MQFMIFDQTQRCRSWC